MKIKEKIYNIEIGAIEEIERDMTQQEIDELTKNQEEAQAKAQVAAKAAAAKISLLEKLGITEEEAKLLLS